jgi:hypothetical protein
VLFPWMVFSTVCVVVSGLVFLPVF